MTPDNNDNVDKNSFLFLFNEDIYVIKETSESSSLKVGTNDKVEEAPIISAKNTVPEKKTPAIPKQTLETAPKDIKDYAVIIRSKEELNTGKELLGKILGAIKIDLGKVDMITSEGSEKTILNHPQHKFIITFGLNEIHKQPLYKVIKNGNSTLLHSNNLSELEKNVEMKKALWAALKSFL